MPLASKPRRTLEDLEAAAAAHRPVQDRVADYVAIDQVRVSPRNPRQKVEGLDELGASLREYGLLQPVVVRRVNGAYELIAGHRRLAAAKQLGWGQIAAVVRNEGDDQAYLLTLTENLQREDLSPKEEAAALEVLVRERGWTTRQVGEAIKRSHTFVSRRLRVFEDAALASFVIEGKLPVATAEELLRTPDAQTRQDLARQAAELEWTAVDARQAVSEIGRNHSKVADLLAHLRRAVADAAQIEPESLTPAERKQVRQARAALGRLLA